MSVVVIVILAQDVLKVSYLSKPCFDIIPSKAEDNSPAFRSNWGILERIESCVITQITTLKKSYSIRTFRLNSHSMRASSPERSSGGAGKGRRAFNLVQGRSCKLSFPFPPGPPERPGELACRLHSDGMGQIFNRLKFALSGVPFSRNHLNRTKI